MRFYYLAFMLLLISACSGKPANMGNSGSDIIAFGDSLTYGYGAPKDESYPAVLGGIIGREIVNLGVSGDTAQDGVERIAELDDYNPYMVLIEFGANDYMRKRPFEQTKQALTDIVDHVQRRGAIAVIVDTGGPGMGKYTDLMKDLAKEKKALFVPAIMAGIFTDRSLKSDMIHPNAKGYAIIAQRIHKRIKPYVE